MTGAEAHRRLDHDVEQLGSGRGTRGCAGLSGSRDGGTTVMRPTVIGCEVLLRSAAQSSSIRPARRRLPPRMQRGARRRRVLAAWRRTHGSPASRSSTAVGEKSSSGGEHEIVRVARTSSAGQWRITALPEHVLDAIEEIAFVLFVVARRAGSNFSFGSAFASCSSRCRCSLVSFFGVWTCTVANRSPRPAAVRRRACPCRAASASCRSASLRGSSRFPAPSSVGTWISPPSASVVKFTGISQNRFMPSRRKNSCSCTWTTT